MTTPRCTCTAWILPTACSVHRSCIPTRIRGYKFRAYSIYHAAERYFKSYRRRNKEMSDHEDSASHECKPMWAHLRVKDMDTGFTYYLGR